MKRTFFKSAALAVALACPLFTSCYDDAWINAEIDRLDTKIEALEKKLNDEVTALQQLVSGLVTVKDVAEDEATGVVTVTLSNGETIEVQPAYEDARTLVTYIEEDGVKYWASCGQDGKKTPILDADGERIPVDKATPQVKEENGIVYISLDRGETWVETGNTLFTGAEIVYTDMYTEEEESYGAEEMAQYVTITLADGSTFSVTLDGAAVLVFGSPYLQAYTELMVPAGQAFTNFQMYRLGVSEVIYQVPQGWKVEEESYYGEIVLNITAPTEEAIASGAAVEEGVLKAVGVCEGGKAIATKMLLTTKVVKSISVQKDVATVEVNQGFLQNYVYGITPAADFDADAIVAEIQADMGYWGYEGMYPMSYGEDLSMPVAEILPEIVYGESYVLWVVPVLADPNSWDSMPFLGHIASTPFVYVAVDVKAEVSFNAIQVEVEMQGVDSYYVTFARTSDADRYDSYEDYALQSTVNNPYAWNPVVPTPYTEPYSGSVLDFAQSWESIMPDTDYFLCIIPSKMSGVYTEGDVYVYEFTSEALQSGGAIKLTAGEPVLDYTSIAVELTSDVEASFVYYSWVEEELLPTITDKTAYLLENGSMEAMTPTTVRIANLKPNTSRVLLALAVDAEGKYGEVFEETYTSTELTYNDVVVTITPAESEDPTKPAFTLSADAEVASFTYWIGPKDDYYFENPNYGMGGTLEGASEALALRPRSFSSTTPDAATVAPRYSLDYLKECVIVANAVVKDAEGNSTYSKAVMYEFQIEYPLGNYVNEDDAKWAEAKPEVKLLGVEAREFVEATWTVSVKEGYTVVKSICIDPEYLASHPSAKDKTIWLLTQSMFSEYSYGMYVDTDYATGEPLEQPYYSCHYATAGDMIYTVIKDAEGNHYQYYEYDPQITSDGGFGI